jgi:hypothetical protein
MQTANRGASSLASVSRANGSIDLWSYTTPSEHAGASSSFRVRVRETRPFFNAATDDRSALQRVVVVDADTARSLTTTTLQSDGYGRRVADHAYRVEGRRTPCERTSANGYRQAIHDRALPVDDRRHATDLCRSGSNLRAAIPRPASDTLRSVHEAFERSV